MTERPWGIRRPFQIESYRRRLSQSEENEGILRQLQHCRENLDAVVFALSNHHLASDRRQHLQEILLRYQREHDTCLEELGFPAKSREKDPLWFFNQLDPETRAHLAAILGVTEEPSYFPVLEIKAEEYITLQSAFQSLARDRDFRERQMISRDSPRAALMLSLSGSLIQISEPLKKGRARRYLYQNIYGNAHPPEGILVLDRDLQVGHRVQSVELTSSPLRLLVEVSSRLSWQAQSETFEQMTHTLSSLGSRSASQLASSGWQPQRQTGLVRLDHHSAAERVFRQEYANTLAQFARLRELFMGGDSRHSDSQQSNSLDDKQIEAELLTQCHLLQTGARELGFDTCTLEDALEFTTEDSQIYQISPNQPSSITVLPRGNAPEILLVKVTVGRQRITVHAPIVFIGQDGCVVEVTGSVKRLVKRGAI